MGVSAVLVDAAGRQAGGLEDPAGGSFDAAGDVDRLLDAVPQAATWSGVDVFGETRLSSAGARALLAELPLLEAVAVDGPERRGLARLSVLAAMCERDDSLTLLFVGD